MSPPGAGQSVSHCKILSRRLILKLKLQYFGHLMGRANSLGKTPKLEKIEDRKRRGQQSEMVGWHHQVNGHEFEQTPGDGEGQGSLACCSPWGRKELDMTKQQQKKTKTTTKPHTKNVSVQMN